MDSGIMERDKTKSLGRSTPRDPRNMDMLMLRKLSRSVSSQPSGLRSLEGLMGSRQPASGTRSQPAPGTRSLPASGTARSPRPGGGELEAPMEQLEESGSESGSEARPDNMVALKQIFLSPMCLLLVCSPLGVFGYRLGFSDSTVFWLNFLALIPLAKILGDATEELAACLKNDMLSGLLNATFGNAVEMIMTVAFLRDGQYLVVKATLLGSILSNMLLVLGMSFLFGGCVPKRVLRQAEGREEPLLESTMKDKTQSFSALGAMVNTSMLLVSCLSLTVVTIFTHVYYAPVPPADQPTGSLPNNDLLPISRIVSVISISAYIAYIIFQLFTHKDLTADEQVTEEDAEEDNAPGLSLPASLTLLAAATVVVAVSSEVLTGALNGALEGSPMGKSFVGIILLPIVGNACEHASAIRFAIQDKAGLSVGIAVGSSVQIALFVTPFSVLVGWMVGGTEEGLNMDLDFGPLNVAVLTLSVLVMLSVILDGTANWLEGYMLCAGYAIIAVLYWYVPGDKSEQPVL